MSKKNHILFDGPFESSNGETELASWAVSAMDEDGDEVGEIYRFTEYNSARDFARELALQFNIPLYTEATPD